MEFCEGVSLKELIAGDAPLEPHRAIRITRQILVAARFAHRRGVIHRDLKPQNVIIDSEESDENFNVKVADFGIARSGSSEITEVGAIMGTAQYLSPEQAQGKPVTGASDLYSIGIVLYEMLTGRPPFDGDSAVAIALKHVSQPPPAPRELRPRDSARLEAVRAEGAGKGAGRPLRRGRLVPARPRGSGVGALARRGWQHGVVRAGWRRCAARPRRPPLPRQRPFRLPALRRRTFRRRTLRRNNRRAGGATFCSACSAPPRWSASCCWRCFLPAPIRSPCRSCWARRSTARASELESAGFKVDIDRRSDLAPVDTVFRQVPSATAKVDEGSTVTLFVSNGPTTVKVPDVLGLTQQDARRRVRRSGLRPTLEQENSRKVPEGNVIRTDPGPGSGDRARLPRDAGRQLRPQGGGGARRQRAGPEGRGGPPARGGLERRGPRAGVG